MGLFEAIKERFTAAAVKEALENITNRDFHLHLHISVNPTFVQKEKTERKEV